MSPPRTALPPELSPRPTRGRAARAGRAASRPVRVLTWLAGLLSLLVLVAGTGGWVLLNHYNGQIGRIDIRGVLPNEPSAAADGPAVNFLLVGSDTRNYVGGPNEQAPPGSPQYVTGQRSDTVILVHVPPGNGKITIVSFPRDSWVTIPAFDHYPEHEAKLNSAFAEGGPALLVALIENLSGLRVDHFVEIDFPGFVNMVNALGGVTVCVGTTRHDPESGDFLTAGVHHINGVQALAFVRDRMALPLGDLDRIKDQQYFLSVVMHDVLSAGTLVDPFELNAFLNALSKSVTVDQDLTLGEMRDFALRLRHLDPAHVTFETLPVANPAGWEDGQSVVLLDWSAMQRMFADLRSSSSGSSAGRAPARTARLTVPPSGISVLVQNGSSVNGLAHRAAADLAGDGFSIAGAGNAPTPTGGQTVVRYGPSRAESALTVAAAVPGAVLQPDATLGSTVVLVVGSGYHGAVPVRVGSTVPTPRSLPAAPAGAPSDSQPTTAANLSCAP